MPGQGFDISITSNEILVEQDGSLQSGTTRATAGVMCILGGLISLARLLLEVARTLNVWNDDPLSYRHPVTAVSKASGATHVILLLEGSLAVFIFYLLLVGVRFFFPGGEKLHCNRTTFTYSHIPWISLRSRWTTKSFPVPEVTELMYGVIREGDSDKGIKDVYGISFLAQDKEYKIFSGLEAPDADDITRKLRSLGVDVIVNQDMARMIAAKNQEPMPFA